MTRGRNERAEPTRQRSWPCGGDIVSKHFEVVRSSANRVSLNHHAPTRESTFVIAHLTRYTHTDTQTIYCYKETVDNWNNILCIMLMAARFGEISKIEILFKAVGAQQSALVSRHILDHFLNNILPPWNIGLLLSPDMIMAIFLSKNLATPSLCLIFALVGSDISVSKINSVSISVFISVSGFIMLKTKSIALMLLLQGVAK